MGGFETGRGDPGLCGTNQRYRSAKQQHQHGHATAETGGFLRRISGLWSCHLFWLRSLNIVELLGGQDRSDGSGGLGERLVCLSGGYRFGDDACTGL